MYKYRKLIRNDRNYIRSKAVNMRKENNIQLSVRLLECILITRGTWVEQKQMRRLLEFVDNIVNSILPPPSLCTHHHLQAAPGLGEAKARPRFAPGKQWGYGLA